MPPITRVFVIVPKADADPAHPNNAREIERVVPIPTSLVSGAGGTMINAIPGKVYAVPWGTYVRKRITQGDLALATRDGKRVNDAAKAAAPDDVKLEHDGTIASDQRPDEVINAEAAKAAELAAAKAPRFDTSDTKGKA